MDVHQNARTTPHSREKIVGRSQRGETAREIAEALEICESTVRKWLRRYRTEGRTGLRDRSRRPRRSPAATPAALGGLDRAAPPSAVDGGRDRGAAAARPVD